MYSSAAPSEVPSTTWSSHILSYIVRGPSEERFIDVRGPWTCVNVARRRTPGRSVLIFESSILLPATSRRNAVEGRSPRARFFESLAPRRHSHTPTLNNTKNRVDAKNTSGCPLTKSFSSSWHRVHGRATRHGERRANFGRRMPRRLVGAEREHVLHCSDCRAGGDGA